MAEFINRNLTKTISWASIFAGVLAVLAISFLLSLLGIALGFSMLDPMSHDDITNGSGTALSIWTLVSLFVSLGIGGYLAGKLAGMDGAIHGFLVWALSLLIGILLSVMTISSAVKATANTVGSIASVTGSLASSLGQGSANLLQNSNVLENVIPSGSSASSNGDSRVAAALSKSNVPQLQPDYLESQMEWAKNQTQEAIKQIAVQPQQYQEISKNLVERLNQRLSNINSSITQEEVRQAILAGDNSFTTAEADQAASNFIQARNEAIQRTQGFFNELVTNINNADQYYAQLKEQAREQAAAAAKTAAKTALWSFIGLLVGLLIASFAGRFAANAKQH